MLIGNKKTLLTLAFLLITSLLYSGKIKKGFEALNVYNYFKAKSLFEKSLKKKVVPASYGLSILYYRNDNPFHNLDSASKFVRQAKDDYAKLELKKQEKLVEFNIDSIVIEVQKDRIDSALFARTNQIASFEAYENYIKSYPTSKLIPSAIESRNKAFYKSIQQQNTADAYLKFIEKYPKAQQIRKAKLKYEELLYKEQTSIGDAATYRSFIKNYPNSPYKDQAQDSVYLLQTKEKTVVAYDQFIKSNRKNPNVNRAWKNLYKLYTADYSPERLVEFRIDYPDYPFKNQVEEDMKLVQKKFFPFKSSGKWGFMDNDGNVMIQAEYDFVETFQEGLALVIKNNRLGYINKSGEIVIPMDYDDGETFVNGLAIVAKDDYYGMVNRVNKVVIPLKYEVLSKFSNGLALVADDKGYGFINELGNEVIPINLSYATEFKNGFAIVEVDKKKGIINTEGEFVVEAQYSWLELFGENEVCRAKNDTAYGLLNKNGEEVTPFVYDQIGEFNSGLALAKKGDKYGYIALSGEEKIAFQYDFSEGALLWGEFEDGYAKYSRKGKFGVVDTAGKELTPSIFEDIVHYKTKGYTQVKKRGKWGYMNAALQLKISYDYDESFPFTEESAVVKKDTAWGLINKKGEWIVDPLYSAADLVQDSLFIVKSSNGYGLISNAFEEIIPIEYDKIVVEPSGSMVQLYTGQRMFYFDLETRKYIKPFYDRVGG